MFTTTTGFARYRTRPVEIEAIRFLGPDNCEEVFAFLGLDHPDNDVAHDLLENIGEMGHDAEVGDWIIRDTDGSFDVYTDEEFHDEFEAVVNE